MIPITELEQSEGMFLDMSTRVAEGVSKARSVSITDLGLERRNQGEQAVLKCKVGVISKEFAVSREDVGDFAGDSDVRTRVEQRLNQEMWLWACEQQPPTR